MSVLIKNGKVFDVTDGSFHEVDILIRGRKIVKMDPDIVDLEMENLINAEGRQIFPGFIDAHSHIGMWTDTPGGNDANECVDPVTPLMRAVDGLNPKDKSFKEAVASGFTTTLIVPGSGNVIGGQGAIIKTAGKTVNDMTENPYACLKIAFGENPISVYGSSGHCPSSRMAVASILEAEFTRAILYKEKRDSGGTDKDHYWETYLPVIERKIPLKIHAHRADDILTAIRVAEKFNFRYTLDHVTEGHLILDELDKSVPFLLGPPLMFKTKPELCRGDRMGAKAFVESGFTVSLISDHPFSNVRYLPAMAGTMVKEGLDYADAIRMLTINPATALEIDDAVGSIEVGKDADLVIFDGDPLEIRSQVEMTIIKGQVVYQEGLCCF